MNSIANWQFLHEPFYRWVIFLVAVSLFLIVWHFVLRHMQAAVA